MRIGIGVWLGVLGLASLAVVAGGGMASSGQRGDAGGGPFRFQDISATSGVDFVLNNSVTPERHQIETMVGGVAVFDFDNDGRPDIFFTNGAKQPELRKTGPEFYNRLYRNKGSGAFEDVTEKAGVRGEGFTTGTATGDYDNDGYVDLFVAGVRRSFLYRNRGDGTFEDVTEKAGLLIAKNPPWSITAGWFDYDQDGDLDLFVVNYVVWDPKTEAICGNPEAGYRTYCHPKYYTGLPNLLYRNNGDGTFTDVSEAAGISRHIGKGMGISFADYDGDGDLDVFVCNDTVPNFLFRNDGGGKFSEVALRAGVGFNDDGRALSSMGSDFRDVDNDGREDIFVTALANETHPLFLNLGKGLFADATYPSRLGAATLPLSGWSNAIFDLDNDGWKDLLSANGDVQDNTELYSDRQSRQPLAAHRNLGNRTFALQTFGRPAMHRGAAFGDFDGDGRVDVVVSVIGERAKVLLNRSGEGNNWVALRLTGTKSSRDAIGARITVTSASGKKQWNHVTTSVGYACSSDKPVYFGLGKDAVKEIEIRWPSGAVQTLSDVEVNRYLEVREP